MEMERSQAGQRGSQVETVLETYLVTQGELVLKLEGQAQPRLVAEAGWDL